MKPGLILALSEFSKGHWAIEPPPSHPARLDRLARAWSRLSWISQLTFARYMSAFFIGVVTTLAWQSYGNGTKEETFAAASADSVLQSVDKLAAEVAKVQTVQQYILARISTPSPRPVAASARPPALRPPAVR
jgi:hypothetical protein